MSNNRDDRKAPKGRTGGRSGAARPQLREVKAKPAPKTERLLPQQCKKVQESATDMFLRLQTREGFWIFPLECDCTIPSEYVLLQRFLGREISQDHQERIRDYILAKQLPDGGWPLFDVDGRADISCSVKAYWALKILGLSPDEEPMIRARMRVLSMGGAASANVFTRITMALFGQIPWITPPYMPVEIMLLPRWFFFHLSKVSYWSRAVIVPLLLLYAKKPVCRLRPEESILELFASAPDKLVRLDHCTPGQWRKNGFIILDRILKKTMHLVPRRVHERAMRKAERWTLEHMQGEGGIGAIFPAMANAVMALKVFGYAEDHPDYVRGIKALDDLVLERTPEQTPQGGGVGWSDGQVSAAPEITPINSAATRGERILCQACVSPIWDTCLTINALAEGGMDISHPAMAAGVDWLFSKQILAGGDWSERSPDLPPGGWAFQFENAFYPDIDDTAMIVMSLLRAGSYERADYRKRIHQAAVWVTGMQSSDGGWGAFDIDNNSLYLNDIPFADHGALLDPPTSDLTGRCVEMLAMLGYDRSFAPLARGLDFLYREQEDDGSWFGRWGVNYIYGVWSVLSALRITGEDMDGPRVRRAVDWLRSKQNSDGGWGESCLSYEVKEWAGVGESTPSQTSWALLGLLAAGRHDLPEVRRGVRYLAQRQRKNGGWEERHFTGAGFPRVFYLRYHGYCQFFPLWAINVYSRLSYGEPTCEDEKKLSAPPSGIGIHRFARFR
jgi:squalene-hopene/tetraprenyl-beta-curcumene cyclase